VDVFVYPVFEQAYLFLFFSLLRRSREDEEPRDGDDEDDPYESALEQNKSSLKSFSDQ